MVKVYKPKGVFLANARFIPAWRGLMFSRKLKRNEAVILNVSCYSDLVVHMLFVFQTIDVVILDHNYKVTEIKRMKPLSKMFKPKIKPYFIIEGPRLDVKVGERLKFLGESYIKN